MLHFSAAAAPELIEHIGAASVAILSVFGSVKVHHILLSDSVV